MACIVCQIVKLSEEFCPYNASTKCDHPCLICLKCLIESVTKHETCPYPSCNEVIVQGSERVVLFKEIFSQMFQVYEASYTKNDHCTNDGEEHVFVTCLTGESLRIPLSKSMTVENLKDKIQNRLTHQNNQQKLLYNGKDMEDEDAQLSNYGVTSNSKICLVVCLYSIPIHLDHVVFDLYWGFPMKEKSTLLYLYSFFGMEDFKVDYLDASCLMFCGRNHYKTIDYSHINSKCCVIHSGDRIDQVNKVGHHTIDVLISQIPVDVTHLFFTLSAWDSPSISKFPNPSFRVYKASKSDVNLCKTSFSQVGNSQAVIMCYVTRCGRSGRWKIFESGKVSAGNARHYAPLVATIKSLIDLGH